MGELRRTDNEKVLGKLSKTKNLRNALELMVGLQEKIFMEEKKVTEYDIKTGNPVKFDWVPYKKFGNNFTFGGEHYGGNIKVRLANEVIKEIKKGPVCFDFGNKRYIAKFETKDHSDFGYGTCLEYLVYLSEARILDPVK